MITTYKYKCPNCSKPRHTSIEPTRAVTCRKCGHSMTHTHTVTPANNLVKVRTDDCVTKLADLPKLFVKYDGCTYSESAVDTVPLDALKKSRDRINKKLRNYKRFAKTYGWELS